MKLTRTSLFDVLSGTSLHKAEAMDHTRGAVVPLIGGHASGLLGRLHLREQRGMIAVFHAENIVQTVGMQRLDVGGIGTQTVFGHDELEVGVVLTQLGNEAFGGVAFTIIFARAVLFDDGFWHQGNHGPLVRMDKRRAQHLVGIRDRPVAVDLLET